MILKYRTTDDTIRSVGLENTPLFILYTYLHCFGLGYIQVNISNRQKSNYLFKLLYLHYDYISEIIYLL